MKKIFQMDNIEGQYLTDIKSVLQNGTYRDDRTNTGVYSTFAPAQLIHVSTTNEVPLFTSKRVPFKSVLAETLWFTQGRTDLESLRADGCTWWDEWALEDDSIGRGYGAQLRNWVNQFGEVHDQLQWVINEIKTNPTSRRLVLTMWNAGELQYMALPPCHGALIQFYVDEEANRLDMLVYIRSSDMFLGLPTNIPSYYILQRMVAQVTGKMTGVLSVQLGDAHVYSNHVEQVEEMLTREPRPLPTLEMDPSVKDIDDFRMEHFTLNDYNPHPTIKAPVAV